MYQHVCVCMPAIAERLRQAYPALLERACLGSIPVEYVVSLSHILGKLQLIPAGDYTVTTAPFPEACTATRPKAACYHDKLGVCDRQGAPGSGSPLFYINTCQWAMVWPNDYPALAT